MVVQFIVSKIETDIIVTNRIGLHARPARLLVQTAARFQSQILVRCGWKTANAKSILSILKLGAVQGNTLTLSAEGQDAQEALQALIQLAQRKFDEE